MLVASWDAMLRTWCLGARDFRPLEDRDSFAAGAPTKAFQTTPSVPSLLSRWVLTSIPPAVLVA